MKTRIKMIITDLDGTLLNGEDQITSCDRTAMLRAQDAGIITVIATGRPLTEALWCVNEINAYPYFIGMNGCRTVNLLTGEVYHEAFLPAAAARKVLQVLSRLPVFFEAYTRNGIESLAGIRERIYQSGLHINFIQNVLQHISFRETIWEEGKQIYKFFIPMDSPQMAERLRRELTGISGISVITSSGSFIEVIPAGCNKAVGVKAVCLAAGIRAGDILAVGDSHNDIEMLKFCGIGAAVGNAKEDVFKIADIRLPDHNHGGISAAVDFALRR